MVAPAIVADLGFVRMGVRDYDARLGRFTPPDPLFWAEPERCVANPYDCNLYGYARGNPLAFADPTGMASEDMDVGEGAIQPEPGAEQGELYQMMYGNMSAEMNGEWGHFSWDDLHGDRPTSPTRSASPSLLPTTASSR